MLRILLGICFTLCFLTSCSSGRHLTGCHRRLSGYNNLPITYSIPCPIDKASSYSSSPQNVEALRKIRARPVRVGEFTAAEPGRSMLMVGGDWSVIETPEGEPFSEYV